MSRANNVVNLSGIPVSIAPEQRFFEMSIDELAKQTVSQAEDLHVEVMYIHDYHQHMATLCDEDAEAIHMHSAIVMRQFDNRLGELESLAHALRSKLGELS